LSSLVKQLAEGQSSLSGDIKSLYDKHKAKRTRPSSTDLLSVLQSVAAMYSKVFIVLDALDECEASNGCLQDFLSEIFSFRARLGANIFATSRPSHVVTEEFKNSTVLEIRARDEDVRKYLDGRMAQLKRDVDWSAEFEEEIKVKIIGAAQGMYEDHYELTICTNFTRFLLVQLHFDSLIGEWSEKQIRFALERLPTGDDGYDKAYRTAMERIEGQLKPQKKLAKMVLSWITCARRPLSTTELQHAVAIETNTYVLDENNLPLIDNMVSVCAGLVTVDKDSNIIRLVHYTTQEYFQRTRDKWLANAESDIAKSCVTYISFSAFERGVCLTYDKFKERLSLNKLYDYAARNWGHHARKDPESYKYTIAFLEDSMKVRASYQVIEGPRQYDFDSQKYDRSITGLHLVAYFGLQETVARLLLDKGAEINATDEYGRTPLSWAAYNGHEAIARLLLDKGAEVNATDDYGVTPLSEAASNGHEAIARLLLDKGAEVNATDIYGVTPLLEAASNGHEAVARLLLDKGAEINATDISGRTPLLWAASNGHEAIARLLLDKGAEVNANYKYRMTPL
jgi:hypothetical protein